MASGATDEAADRALSTVARKLDKTLSVEYTVNELITEASDPANLALMYTGACPNCCVSCGVAAQTPCRLGAALVGGQEEVDVNATYALRYLRRSDSLFHTLSHSIHPHLTTRSQASVRYHRITFLSRSTRSIRSNSHAFRQQVLPSWVSTITGYILRPGDIWRRGGNQYARRVPD